MEIPESKVAAFIIGLAEEAGLDTSTELYDELRTGEDKPSDASIEQERIQDLLIQLGRSKVVSHQEKMRLYRAYVIEVTDDGKTPLVGLC